MLRRTAAVLLALTTLAVSSCGDDGDDSTEADPAGVLTSDQVDEALLPIGTTVGEGEVGPEDLPGFADSREVDHPECRPLVTLLGLDPSPYRSARVDVEIKPLGSWVNVQLLTYEGDDAEQALGLVDAAIDACAGGFTYTTVRDYPVNKLVRETGPDLGDQTVAFATRATDTFDDEGFQLDEHTVLVRDGQQVLAFRAGSNGDDAEATALLTDVVAAQWKRYSLQR